VLTIDGGVVTNAKAATMAANTIKANATAATAAAADLAVAANTVVGRVAGNIVSAALVDAQVATGTLTNAKLLSMGDATVKGRALAAGTGVPTDLTRAQVEAILPDYAAGTVSGRALGAGTGARSALTAAQLAAIAAPALAGTDLFAAGGQLHVRSLFADFAVNVPAVSAGALGFVDVSTAGTALAALAIDDNVNVLPRADAPPCSYRVSAANTVRLGYQGGISAITAAPYRIYKPAGLTTVSAVSAWLRVAQATSDVNGVSSLPDIINANPAVQSVNSRKPGVGVSANGLPTMTFDGTADMLSWPLAASNNGTAAWGIGLWLKAGDLSVTTRDIIAMWVPDSSAYKLNFSQFGQQLFATVFKADGTSSSRQGVTVSNVITSTALWYFVTFEWDSLAVAESDRFTITVNGVKQACTFSSGGTPGTITTLHAPTGNATIGATGTALYFFGSFGANIYVLGSKMAGATEGLLTPAARAALMTYEQPT
jgi:hypothetical protein